MKFRKLHHWNVTPRQAVAIQRDLQRLVVCSDAFGEIRYVAGIDVAYDRGGNYGYGGVAVYTFPGLRKIEERVAIQKIPFPYIPGLLSFREIPVVLPAIRQLATVPDLFILDGQGIAHPREMGIATHMGLILDTPAIGCAKSCLIGQYREPGLRKGCRTMLRHRTRVLGAVVRTRSNIKPVFVSIGHRVELKTAVRVILRCTAKFRIPIPTREADHLVETLKREHRRLKC